jgi:hypothetical protein
VTALPRQGERHGGGNNYQSYDDYFSIHKGFISYH